MKYLNKFINEKLILNKSTKLYYDVDNIKGYNKEVLYSSRWEFKDDNDEAIQWNDCKHELSTIDKESNTGFIITQFNSLGELRKKNVKDDLLLYDYSESLGDLIEKVVTGNDYGYEVRLYGGHLEIECINSGSSGTYYIYQLNKDAWNNVDEWFRGDESVNSLDFLFIKGAIIPIEMK